MKNIKYTLGLDIGIASVGAALLGDAEIIGLHVRAFNAADQQGEPLNAIRREARSNRRRIKRRAQRMANLIQIFHQEGLIHKPALEQFISSENNPWTLRYRGLNCALNASEWASVIYHIVKHRGFLSNRKSEREENEKAGKMLSAIDCNQKLMYEKGYVTVGEMIARDSSFEHAKRNKSGEYSHTISRIDLDAEIKILFERQRLYGNGFASASFEKATRTKLMEQRAVLTGADLLKMVGNCTFESNEKRAPKASHSAEKFRWFTLLNNLRLIEQGNSRMLHENERQQILALPFVENNELVTYKKLRKALQLSETTQFSQIDYKKENAENAKFFSAEGFHKIRKAYQKAGLVDQWQDDSCNFEQLNTLAYARTVFKDDDEARKYLQSYQISSEVIEAVLTVSFKHFVYLSITALDKITPYMMGGLRYDEAVLVAGYQHHSHFLTNNKSKYLPPIDGEIIRNPVVFRSLNQARKLVNAIVKQYGPPFAVHIELARDLNKPFEERRKIKTAQDEFRERKQHQNSTFQETFGRDPMGVELIKWSLYNEQNAQCAYTQTGFDLNRLFEDGYCEIDHALPYSRSFNNAMSNKVLVCKKENQNKGNKIPFEYFGSENNSSRWHAFCVWVESNAQFSFTKKRNLLKTQLTAEDTARFKERNLSDTRYACKVFKEMVDQHLELHPESTQKNCVVVSGQLTSLLRTRWGLLKVRDDGDLHHALDAAVVAATSHGMVQRMANYAKRKELDKVRDEFIDPDTQTVIDRTALQQIEAEFPKPWSHFREELLSWLKETAEKDKMPNHTIYPIRVSRAVQRRNLGAAHHETIRGCVPDQPLQSTKRCKLTKITLGNLPQIAGYNDPRNQAMIQVIRERLEQYNNKPDKAFVEPLYYPTVSGNQALMPQIKSVRLIDTQKSGITVRHGVANNGDMLRVDIFGQLNQKTGAMFKFMAVPIYVADSVKAELPNKAAIQNKSEDQWSIMDDSYVFLFSVYQNDWVKLTFKNKPCLEGYFNGFNRSTAAIDIYAHDRNSLVGKSGLIQGIGIKTAVSFEKYHVDLLGRLYKAQYQARMPLYSK